MSQTPSHRRKEGREAFDIIANPMDTQPYKKGTWEYDYYLKGWLEGWDGAAIRYNKTVQNSQAPCAQCVGRKEEIGDRFCSVCGYDLRGEGKGKS